MLDQEFENRREVLELARADYDASRFHSVVLALIPVMDGFVNDVDKTLRKGLHARDSAEMNPWDSVVGHHMGLARVHRKVFTKPFRKSSDARVENVFRHGILHGLLTNFNNEVVATKCWNLLFALDDWADALGRPPARPNSANVA